MNPRNANSFLGDITGKRRSTILASFQKICPGIKTATKDEIFNPGSPLGSKSQAHLSEKEIIELEIETKFSESLKN